MKTQLKKATIFMLLVICITTSCKKDKAEQSPESYRVTAGNQSFGVYLNGQPWVPDYRDPGNSVEPISVRMIESGNNYNFMTIYGQKANEEISIYIPPPLTIGRKYLNKTTFPYPNILRPPGYGMYYIYSPTKRYLTNENITGYVDIIRADTFYRSIEGTFQFDAINTTTNEKISVTNGYFRRGYDK
jgi:Family of unknown function (DUF6252)